MKGPYLTNEERKIEHKISHAGGFPLLSEEEMEIAAKLGERAESYFWELYPEPRDEDFPDEGFMSWYVNLCVK